MLKNRASMERSEDEPEIGQGKRVENRTKSQRLGHSRRAGDKFLR